MERAYKDACIIALTETWFDEEVLESEVSLDHFSILRANRTCQSGKETGSGICIYVNSRWWNNIKIHNRVCTPDVEKLTMILPFTSQGNSPRWCVYISPSAKARKAVKLVAENANIISEYK